MRIPTALIGTLLLAGATIAAAPVAGAEDAAAPVTDLGSPPVPDTVAEIVAEQAGAEAAGPQGAGFVVHRSSGDIGWSTTGIKPIVAKAGPGTWTVRFDGITGAFGVTSLTAAPGVGASLCTIANPSVVSGGLLVGVRCFNAGGTPADAAGFALSYTSKAGANEGWFTADQPNNATGYTPGAAYSWIGGSITTKSSAGTHRTVFSNLGLNTSTGRSLVSAVSSTPSICSRSFTSNFGTRFELHITCVDLNGTPVAVASNAHMITSGLFSGVSGDHSMSTIVWDGNNYSFGKSGGNVGPLSIVRTAKGVTQVTIAGGATAGPGLSHVVASNPWQPTARCNSSAADSGANAVITVKCWNGSAALTDMNFDLYYFGAP